MAVGRVAIECAEKKPTGAEKTRRRSCFVGIAFPPECSGNSLFTATAFDARFRLRRGSR